MLVNTTSDSVRVELRTGRQGACDIRRVLEVRAIAPGKYWSIRTDRPLCYRVQASGAPIGSPWSAWRTPTLSRTAVTTDSL